MKTKTAAVLLALTTSLSPVAAQTDWSWLCTPGTASRFTHTTASYDAVNGYLAMVLGQMAYPAVLGMTSYDDQNSTHRAEYARRLSVVLTGANGWGFTRVTTFRSGLTDAEGFVASSPYFAIVSVRGSESGDPRSLIQDWIQADFNLPMIGYGGGRVHTGFLQASASIGDMVADTLRAHHDFARYRYVNGLRWFNRASQRPIFVTGHSLGGATAVLLARMLRVDQGFNVPALYTHGQPMVGDQAFANAYAATGIQVHRIVNRCDVVATAFGEVLHLPDDLAAAGASVAGWVTSNVPEPVRTPLRGLASWAMGRSRALSRSLSAVNSMITSTGANYVHFGSLRYLNRFGSMVTEPTLTYRRNDRIRVYDSALRREIAPFLPPAPPPLWDVAGWMRYTDTLRTLADRVWATISNPGSFLGGLAGELGVLITDHFGDRYLERTFARLSATQRAGLPEPR